MALGSMILGMSENDVLLLVVCMSCLWLLSCVTECRVRFALDIAKGPDIEDGISV